LSDSEKVHDFPAFFKCLMSGAAFENLTCVCVPHLAPAGVSREAAAAFSPELNSGKRGGVRAGARSFQ
jgi:hypothetical protein